MGKNHVCSSLSWGPNVLAQMPVKDKVGEVEEVKLHLCQRHGLGTVYINKKSVQLCLRFDMGH